MLSPEALKIIELEKYNIKHSNMVLSIFKSNDTLAFWQFLTIAIAISIPLTYLFLSGMIAAILALIMLWPLYQVLKRTEIPLEITFNNNNKTITLNRASGLSRQIFSFMDINNISISSFEEYSDANAFNQTNVKFQYFINAEINGKKISLFRFDYSPIENVKLVKEEIQKLILSQPAMVSS